MIRHKESEAFHNACKKSKATGLEKIAKTDPSIKLKTVIRAEKKVKQAELQDQENSDAV